MLQLENSFSTFLRAKNNWITVGIALLFTLITWPAHDADLMPHYDGSYFATYNWFAAYDLSKLQFIQFSFGPLGFLKNPLAVGDNLIWGFLFQSLLKIGLLISVFRIFRLEEKEGPLFYLLAFLYCCMFKFDFLIYGCVVASMWIYTSKRENLYLAIPGFLAALGFLIKINIGLNASLLIFGWLAWHSLSIRDYRPAIVTLISGFITYFGIWLMCFGNLGGSVGLLTGYLQFVFLNADNTSTFPPNSFLALSIMALALGAFFYLERKQAALRVYLASLPLFLFAIYRYSFARQSGNHSGELLLALIFIFFFYLLFTRHIRPLSALLLLLSISAYDINLHVNGTFSHSKERRPFIGVGNFYDQVWNYSGYKSRWEEQSRNNLAQNNIPEQWKKKIGGSTIDFIPWDLSYFIPNHLNYLPRPSLITAGLPPAAVKKNAELIREGKGPQYILWEKKKWTGEVGGIDRQYLFNTDGLYLRQVMSSYQIKESRDRDVLFEKTGKETMIWEEIEGPEISWGKRIDLGKFNDSKGLYLEMEVDYNAYGWFKKTVYKTKRPSVTYHLRSGESRTYEFPRLSMKSGIWISPYISQIDSLPKGTPVAYIEFNQPSENRIFEDRIKAKWYSASLQ